MTPGLVDKISLSGRAGRPRCDGLGHDHYELRANGLGVAPQGGQVGGSVAGFDVSDASGCDAHGVGYVHLAEVAFAA